MSVVTLPQPLPVSLFTAHNIRLPCGAQTMPALDWFVADGSVARSAINVLRLALGEDLTGHSIVDLGCLEGGYAVEFAKAGMDTLGIEVRQSNFDNCNFVQQALDLPSLGFAKDDVWNLAGHGRFDAAFCSGLLYHLDRPGAFIDLLSCQIRRVLIIHTHFAREDQIEAFPHLSALTENEGMAGRWFAEHEATALADLEADCMKWASWTNQRSFWPTKPALLQRLHDAGFSTVFEQADWLQNWQGSNINEGMTRGYHRTHARCLLVAIR